MDRNARSSTGIWFPNAKLVWPMRQRHIKRRDANASDRIEDAFEINSIEFIEEITLHKQIEIQSVSITYSQILHSQSNLSLLMPSLMGDSQRIWLA